MSDELRKLAVLAKQTRDAQKSYFRDRTRTGLDACKKLERKLDEAIKDVLEPVQAEIYDYLGDAGV